MVTLGSCSGLRVRFCGDMSRGTTHRLGDDDAHLGYSPAVVLEEVCDFTPRALRFWLRALALQVALDQARGGHGSPFALSSDWWHPAHW